MVEKMNPGQASICSAQIHYQMLSVLHHLPAGYHPDYMTAVTDAEGSRWEEEVVNVQLHNCGGTHPLSQS